MICRFALVATVLTVAGLRYPVAAHGQSDPSRPLKKDRLMAVLVNDNRRPAGSIENNRLRLELRAGVGLWRPEGERGPAVEIEAFGAGSGPLQVPAPLIRVPEGTEVLATIRNDLDVAMAVQGLCARDGTACAPVQVPPSSSRDVRFTLARAGTYHYWATTTGMPLAFRAVDDTQLSGALIVDPVGTDPDLDRVFVVTDWTSLTRGQLRELANADDPGPLFLAMNPQFTFTINGLSWTCGRSPGTGTCREGRREVTLLVHAFRNVPVC